MMEKFLHTYVDLGELSGSPTLARVELLDFAVRSLEQCVLKAYDEHFDDIVIYLTGVVTQLQELGEQILANRFLDS